MIQNYDNFLKQNIKLVEFTHLKFFIFIQQYVIYQGNYVCF
jgi:hypothetical protein